MDCQCLMTPNFAITRMAPILRRTFKQGFALLVSLTLLGPFAWSQSAEIPPKDPHREWLGPQYAESVYALMKTKHPHLTLKIDPNDIAEFRVDDVFRGGLGDAISEFRYPEGELSMQHRLMDFARNILPGAYKEFLKALEGGGHIQLSQMNLHSAEFELTQWIKSQADQSISPDRLMEQALLKTKGHVVAAWVLAWNVMREGWPAAGTRNYGFIQKFVSLTGERHLWKGSFNYVYVPPGERQIGDARVYLLDREIGSTKSSRAFKMVVTKRGDDFSYLYHRIGVELLAMVVAKHTGKAGLGRAAGSLGAFGEWFKFRQTSGLQKENVKRVSNDLIAASSGARLYQLIEGKAQINITKDHLNPNYYFRSNPKKYNEKYLLPDGRPASYFGSKADPKYWAASMSVQELKERFHHATHYDALIFNPVILAGGEDYERLHRGLRDYMESSEQSPELNKSIQDYLKGIRAFPEKMDVSHDFDLDPYERYASGNTTFAMQVDPNYDFEEFEKRLDSLLTRVLAHKKSQASSSFKALNQGTPQKPVRCEKFRSGTSNSNY